MANILVLSQYWFPENGVPQRRWSWLTKILVEMGHSVTVVAPPAHYHRAVSAADWLNDLKDQETHIETGPHGERIVRCRYIPAGVSLTGRAVNQASAAASAFVTSLKKAGLFSSGDADLVIGTVPALPTAPLTATVARCLRVPYIIDLRDAWPDLLDQSDNWNEGVGEVSIRERVLSKGPKQLVFASVRRIINLSLYNAHGIILTAETLGSHIEDQLKNSGAKSIPNFVTIRNVFPSKTVFEKENLLERAHNEINVLYAGTLGRAQKLCNALDAVKIAKGSGVTVNLKLVGAGATKEALRAQVQKSDLSVEILPRVPADQLEKYYSWADTALVHLTDWEPLQRAVPSKTYELMSSGIHISGSIAGETAEIIKRFKAGHTVEPENPEALATLWVELARNRNLLMPSADAARWVEEERELNSPLKLEQFLGKVLPSLKEGL